MPAELKPGTPEIPVLALALAALTGLAPALPAAASLPGEAARRAARLAEGAPAAYRADERAVSNWRRETLLALNPAPLAAAALLRPERPLVTRCVKLNNYWCIKRARWEGEIGADEEGHVGFASAGHGARAAAVLLRRYYTQLGRRSALAIVTRWAPAECGPAAPAVQTLAIRGLGQTLRGRWLAHRGRGGRVSVVLLPEGAARPATSPARNAGRVAATRPPAAAKPMAGPAGAQPRPAGRVAMAFQPVTPAPGPRLPDIAVGLGERGPATLAASLPGPRAAPAPRAATERGVASGSRAPPRTAVPPRAAPAAPRPVADATGSVAPLPPASSCTADEQRIRNYAARIAASLGLRPEDDLNLFGADGRPGPNLAPVMLAMSAVELGVLRASANLVEGAIAGLEPAVPAPPREDDASAEVGSAPAAPP